MYPRCFYSTIKMFLLVGVGAAAGCNGAQPGLPVCGTAVAISRLDENGGEVVVRDTSSPLFGVRLKVPPGALPAMTEVVLAEGMGAANAESGEQGIGTAVCISAYGAQLSKPASLILPVDPTQITEDQEVVAVGHQDGERTTVVQGARLTLDEQARLMRVPIPRFGMFQLIRTGKIPQFRGNNADILLVVDNSGSMTPKQLALANSIEPFFKKIENTCVNYHIGIISTDVGNHAIGNVGDDGKLQAKRCRDRGLTGSAAAACEKVCSAGVLSPSRPYLQKDDIKTAADRDALLAQLKCMAVLGTGGSQYESPLAAMRRAIEQMDDLDMKNPALANSGFSRRTGVDAKDSLLSLLFITDEDDSSVRAASKAAFLAPRRVCSAAMDDSSDPTCYPTGASFRGLAVGLDCDTSLLGASGARTCHERPMSLLTPVDEFASFLLGKKSKDRLLVSGIWSLPDAPMPANSITFDLQASPTYYPSGKKAVCVDPTSDAIFGYPQLRLSSFVKRLQVRSGTDGKLPGINESAPYSQTSICQPATWASALDNLAEAIFDRTALCRASLLDE